MREAGERAWLLEWSGDEQRREREGARGRRRAAAAGRAGPPRRGAVGADAASSSEGRSSTLAACRARARTRPLPRPDLSPRAHEIRFTPDGEDLDEIASRCGLRRRRFSSAFTGLTFTVGFLGFTPGFAYLYGLPLAFHLPRRPIPRTAVPAGSVALAGPVRRDLSGRDAGGWNLVGTTPRRLFDLRGDPPFLFSAGDTREVRP